MTVPAGAMPLLTRKVASQLDASVLGSVRVGFTSDGDAVSVLASMLEGAGAVIVPAGAAEVVVETGLEPLDLIPEALVSTTARTAAAFGEVAIPVMACHRARCVRLADRAMGRRLVQETLRLTNRRMPGTRVAVTGYGETARSIAATVVALGGTVGVIEPEAVEALTAVLDGHTLAWTSADMVFACDGRQVAGTDVGAGALLVDVDASCKPTGREVRPGVREFGMGYVVQPRVTRSFEDSDLVLSVAALALERLVAERPGPGVIEVPPAIDAAVAVLAAESAT